MTDHMTETTEQENRPKPRTINWRRARLTLPREHVQRQGEITHLAFALLGRDPAIYFLNAEDAGLGGKPLDLAGESAAGFASVRSELHRLSTSAKGELQ